MLSKVEILILKYLFDNQIDNQIKSQTIRTIAETTNLNPFRVRNNLNHLFSLQSVSLGFKEKNSNTFYISKKGIEIIEKINKSDFSTTL